MTTLGAGLALLVGFVLGLLGGGGSVLMVPILVYVLDLEVKQAIATSLLVVGLVAFIGVISHARQHNVSLRVALAFGPFAVIGAYGGALLATHVSGTFQLVLFALFGFVGSIMMFRGTLRPSPAQELAEYDFNPGTRTILLLGLQGLGVGMITGLIGVGGGFLIVPALVLIARLPMRLAVGTSLLVITANALAGFAGYVRTVPIEWSIVVWFTAIAALGSLVGSAMSGRVRQRHLRQAFALLLAGVSLYVLYRR